MNDNVIPFAAKKVASTEATKVRRILEQVTDPEIPVLTIDEMGILRDVCVVNSKVTVNITPTYSGCPAIDQITADVTTALQAEGYDDVEVKLVLSPAWTTDWMSEDSKEKLRQYGIAPPCKTSAMENISGDDITMQFVAACPQCGSTDTQVVSEFGSTACKALWKCNSCKEPFDYFKPL